ncbi:MAG TPA: PA domain-containing protein [Pyrinomonadaceae bacterium]|nr:PA domain-containing protein [Pyrinomonadaceae bacterium]
MRTAFTKLTLIIFAFSIVGLSAQTSFAGPAQFVIVNINAPGVGFNDPTPRAPVGGNPGTTLGQQRLFAFEHAAAIWSARLDSNVPIRIRAQFVPLGAGVLGSAGPVSVARNFPGALLPNTWYHIALANKLAGVDLNAVNDDITASFSTNFNFYLGLDNNHGTQPDLVAVLLHEFAHGLGFSQLANLATGALFGGGPDAYNTRLFDNTVGLSWPQMTNAQRALSAIRFGRVVWSGSRVTANVPNVLQFGIVEVRVTTPATLAGPVQFGTAVFGPSVATVNVSAPVVVALDQIEVGGNQIDGCTPFTNAAEVAGKIALIERGGACGFAVKARNATEAGAVAAIIYNQPANGGAAPPGMGDDGINGAFVTIPTISLRRLDGVDIFSALPTTVTVNIGNNPNIRAGADELNRARVFGVFPIAGGSSISHFDSVARRNLLMEPAINADLTHKLKSPDDLTFELMLDIGWTFPDADGDGVADDEDCNQNSDTSPTIIIGGIDTGVLNTLFPTGCTMSDLLSLLKAGAANNGAYVSAVAHLTNQWVADGSLTGAQKGAIENAAAKNH